jgi:four helix bundle protein
MNEERTMSRDGTDLRTRTKQFALRVIKAYSAVCRLRRDRFDDAPLVLGKQFLRSGTSIGAQYREACRARSNPEFVSKVESATQEADETLNWFELLVESGLVPRTKLANLMQEADELIAMLVSSAMTAKGNAAAEERLPRPRTRVR